MAPDVALERLEEHATAVDPGAIEEEFARIWRETTDSALGEEASIRVRVLNLVAIAADGAELDRFEEVMQVLPQRHPCRGIVAIASTDYERLAATISAHCWRLGSARRHVCSEEVLLTGALRQERELASAVLALLVPELPVAAWLMGAADQSGSLADRVLDASDLAIIDSAFSRDLLSAYVNVLTIREQHEVPCHDLAWSRLSGWRALIAQLFDGEHGARELGIIESIEIRAGGLGPPSEALLLGGWLLSRLDLAPADVNRGDDALTATLYDGTREVRLRIVGRGDAAIDSVRIRTSDAEFSIEQHAASGHLHVRELWDAGSMQRTVEQSPADDASVIAQTLDGGASSRVYEEALRMALLLLNG